VRIAPCALLVLLAGAPSLSAQIKPPNPPKPKKGDVPQFDGDGEGTRRKTPEKAAETPEQALERAMATATIWPAESGENAIRALVSRGPEMVPLLQVRLRAGTVLERAVAARGLCLLGDKESFEAIRQLLGDPRQRSRFTPLLLSLHDLDAARSTDLALTLLEADQSSLRSAGAALLREHKTPELLAKMRERLAATPNEAVRLDLFVQLEQWKDRELPALALRRFLGDDSHQLAARVDQLLSFQDDPEIRGELIRLAQTDRDRRGMHATLALVLAEHRLNTPLLPEELFDTLLPYVRTGDHLLRAVACVACGTIGYRSELRNEATREKVIPALADLVVNGRFFGDFELCFKLEVATLELLSGEKLGPSVPAWREWLSKSKGAIPGRRDLAAFVPDEDARTGLVRLETQDTNGRMVERVVVVGSDARSVVSAGEKPGWVCLDAETMRGLIEDLRDADFLASDLPRALPDAAEGSVRITVEARGRERTVMGAREDERVHRLLLAVRKSAEPSLWQLLLAPGDAHSKRFAEETAWFTTHPDAQARRSRLIDLALSAIARADDEDARRAFDVLQSLDRLGDSVRTEQIEGIAALLKLHPNGDRRSRRLFELLVGTGRPEAFAGICDALASRGASAVPWLAEAIAAMKTQATALGDPHPFVRIAALDPSAGPRPPSDLLYKMATTADDERVRVKALERLADVADATTAEALANLAVAPDAPKSVQAQALRLLGRIPREDALATLTRAAREGEPAVAAAALEGLSQRGDEAAAAALDAIARERGASDPIGRLALTAMKSLPRGLAADRLRKLMSEAPDALKREAAFALADVGEMDAAPALFDELQDAGGHPRAALLLTYLFCQDLGTESWKFRSLYESRPGVTHAQLFIEALRSGGASVPDGVDLKDHTLVPVLVAAIEDPRWYVRRCALEALDAQTGRSLGSLPVKATVEQIADLAKRWREATSAQAQGSEQH
jgi:HEAT repeat protein